MADPVVVIKVVDESPQGGSGGGSPRGGGSSTSSGSGGGGGGGGSGGSDPLSWPLKMFGRRMPGGQGMLNQLGGMLGEAGGMGGMLASAGMAAGPVMAIYAAANEAGNALRSFARDFGGFATDIVQGNFFKLFEQFGERMTDVLMVINPAAGIFSKFILGIVEASKMLTDAFLAEARRLEAYSPQIAVASAMAEVRTLMYEFGEAQRMGPELARLVENQSRVELALREALEPIKEDLLEFANEMLQIAADIAEWLRDHREVLKGIWDAAKTILELFVLPFSIFKLIKDNWGSISEVLDMGVDAARRRFSGDAFTPFVDALGQSFVDMGGKLGGIEPARPAFPGGPAPVLGQ